MASSLRSRLIVAFAFVILLTLFLAGSAAVWLVRQYQTEREIDRLAELALPLSAQVRALESAGATPDEIAAYLNEQASEIRARIVLIDAQGVIVADSGGSLLGQRVQLPPSVWLGTPGRLYVGSFSSTAGESVVLAVRTPSRPLALRSLRRPEPVPVSVPVVALVAPHQSLGSAWLELAPRLGLAAALALLGSIPVALLLSSSIARPLARMTQASEEMARGNYDQSIEVQGRDEVARLARAFNEMARRVAETHRSMRDFLANVSHDLRTPLTSIQGFSQALIDGTIRSPDEQAEAGRIINEEAERMRRLVEDLLALSRLESGQDQMEPQELDAADLGRAALRRVERRAAEAGLALALEADPLAAPILGDPHRIAQVLDNLLDNALRHTPAGGRITLQVRPGDGPGGDGAGRAGARPAAAATVVAVHNTGSYIPPADLERVFERFYQLGRARSGVGLGLSIARQIVQAHGGTIRAESTPDDGTTFVVTLPALRRPAPRSAPAPAV